MPAEAHERVRLANKLPAADVQKLVEITKVLIENEGRASDGLSAGFWPWAPAGAPARIRYGPLRCHLRRRVRRAQAGARS